MGTLINRFDTMLAVLALRDKDADRGSYWGGVYDAWTVVEKMPTVPCVSEEEAKEEVRQAYRQGYQDGLKEGKRDGNK